MVLGITGILAVAIAPMVSNAILAYSYVQADYDALYKLRYALNRFAYEAREVTVNFSDTQNGTTSPIYNASSLTSTQFTFKRSDFSNDPAAQDTTISFLCSGTSPNITLSLTYGASGTARTLVDELSLCQFTHYTKNGTTTTTSATTVAQSVLQLTVTKSNGTTYASQRRVTLRAGP